MKKLFFLLPLLALFVACQPDDTPITESGYITFANQQVENLTRGDNTITTANLENFDVWGHNDVGIVFNGTKVEKQGDVWSSSIQKMWEHSKTYHFHAFAPSGLITNVGDYPNSERSNGLSNFTYTNEGDKDLVYAYATRTQGSLFELNSEPVQLTFEHLLSRVQFTFNNSLSKGNITISDVQIVEAIKSAELNCADASIANWAWTGSSTGTYNFGSTGLIAKGESGVASNVQFLFPAVTRNYNITFNLVYEEESVEERVASIANVTLEMGKSYNITVSIEDKDIVTEQYKISFFVAEVKDWGSNIEINATLNEELETPSTTGMENGHEYVDLGLPSGLKWATCNVGAESPEEYGDYFAWGEVEPKEYYDWSTYIHCIGNNYFELTKYGYTTNVGSNFGVVDNKTILDPEDDAATVNWGGAWRMPRGTEFNELYDKCTLILTIQNGVNGYKVTGPNGNSIFLPIAGFSYGSIIQDRDELLYLWASTLLNGLRPYSADCLSLHEDFGYIFSDYDRKYGLPVRPVCP